VSTALAPIFSALADETRWSILRELGRADASASALAARLPVTRQAIAKHLAVLAEVGLVESVRVGRELRYRAIGAKLDETARALDAIGAEWDRRLLALKDLVERMPQESVTPIAPPAQPAAPLP
jgi:DNA-binding transcriptional ArsR family regulator